MYLLVFLMFVTAAAVFSSCAGSKGWDVNDTWRPPQHKRYDLARPPKQRKRR